jgi:hypothetical protein
METFPSYALIMNDGYAEKRESALIRSDMESGPPKQAKIKSLVLVTRPVKIKLTSVSDYQAFVEWFSVGINEGADWFNFTDPVSKLTGLARFAGGGLDAVPDRGGWVWTISTTIETWA